MVFQSPTEGFLRALKKNFPDIGLHRRGQHDHAGSIEGAAFITSVSHFLRGTRFPPMQVFPDFYDFINECKRDRHFYPFIYVQSHLKP